MGSWLRSLGWSHLLSKLRSKLATVMMGTLVAQVLPFLAMPVLTRMYGAEEFAAFTSFNALGQILSVFATGRYELGIILGKDDDEVRGAVLLSLGLSILFSILIFGVTFFSSLKISEWIKDAYFLSHWWALPLVVASSCAFNVLNYWQIREGNFRGLAMSRVKKSLIIVFLSLAFYVLPYPGSRLVLAAVLGSLFPLFSLARQFINRYKTLEWGTAIASSRHMSLRLKKFPLFSLPADTVNAFASQLPVFFLGHGFGPIAVAYWGLLSRTLSGPLNIISSAFADVLKQEAAIEILQTGNCRQVWRKNFRRLGVVSLFVFPLLCLVLPWAFQHAFGAEWAPAGSYGRPLVLLYGLGFIASPLSRILYVAERQGIDLVWQIALIIFNGTALWLGVRSGSLYAAFSYFSISYGCMYIVYMYVSWQASHGKKTDSFLCQEG